MNYIPWVVLCFLTVGYICSCDQSRHVQKYVCSAVYSNNQVKIDGILDDSLWQRTPGLILKSNQTGDSIGDTTKLTTIRIGYDNQNLYMAFVCNDTDIWSPFTSRDQHLWNNDAVEVFIDTDTVPNTYVEIEVSPHNVLFDSFITDPRNIDFEKTASFDLLGIRTAVTVNGTMDIHEDKDRQWIAEMSIPFTNLVENFKGIEPEKTRWKINFYRINADKGKKPEDYAWSPTYGSFHVPSHFGILKFGSNNSK